MNQNVYKNKYMSSLHERYINQYGSGNKKIIFVGGLSGFGKTTLVLSLQKYGCNLFSLDINYCEQ